MGSDLPPPIRTDREGQPGYPFSLRASRFPRLTARLGSLRAGTQIAYYKGGFIAYKNGRKMAVARYEESTEYLDTIGPDPESRL